MIKKSIFTSIMIIISDLPFLIKNGIWSKQDNNLSLNRLMYNRYKVKINVSRNNPSQILYKIQNSSVERT